MMQTKKSLLLPVLLATLLVALASSSSVAANVAQALPPSSSFAYVDARDAAVNGGRGAHAAHAVDARRRTYYGMTGGQDNLGQDSMSQDTGDSYYQDAMDHPGDYNNQYDNNNQGDYSQDSHYYDAVNHQDNQDTNQDQGDVSSRRRGQAHPDTRHAQSLDSRRNNYNDYASTVRQSTADQQWQQQPDQQQPWQRQVGDQQLDNQSQLQPQQPHQPRHGYRSSSSTAVSTEPEIVPAPVSSSGDGTDGSGSGDVWTSSPSLDRRHPRHQPRRLEQPSSLVGGGDGSGAAAANGTTLALDGTDPTTSTSTTSTADLPLAEVLTTNKDKSLLSFLLEKCPRLGKPLNEWSLASVVSLAKGDFCSA